MTKITFENLSKYDPNLKNMRAEDGVFFSTSFWEDLYQLFKARMIEEQSSNKTDK